MVEIGSEFWLDKSYKNMARENLSFFSEFGNDREFLLSGRTAIDFVLKDILKNKKITNVYFPSYCCQSMLLPFIDNGINVAFYNIDFEDRIMFNINTEQKCDIFFAMNYFGFSKGRMDEYIEIFKKRNIIVIEDSTHSLLSDKPYNIQSDYIIASLRKWFPVISGGLAIKTREQFEIKPKNETLVEMIKLRKSAMLEKGRYMGGDTSSNKERFLKKYNIANNMLNMDYSLYSIDKISYQILQNLDINSVIKKRKENVRYLYKRIPVSKTYELLFFDLENGDCPIFVPIIFNNKIERNNVRKYLINNNIYCPVHWPKPTISDEQNAISIYDKELSLVVDQRYDDTDMRYLIRRLEEFYE